MQPICIYLQLTISLYILYQQQDSPKSMTTDCPSTMSTLFEPSFVINFLVSYLSAMQLNYVTVFNCWNLEGCWHLNCVRVHRYHDLLLRYRYTYTVDCFPLFTDNRYLMGNLSGVTKFVQLVGLNDAHSYFADQAQRVYRRDRTRIGVIFEFGCPSSRRMLHECADKRCFSTSIHWVMFDRNTNDSVLVELEETALYVDAELTVLSKDSRGIFSLYDVYNNGFLLGGKLNITFDREVFAFDDGHIALGESTVDAKPKYQNRNNLSDISLRAGVVSQLFPFLNNTVEKVLRFFESYEKPGTDAAARIGYMLTKALEADLKFKTDFVFYGQTLENGTFENNAEAVLNKHIDLSIFGVMKLRTDELTCIQNFMAYRSMFIFRTPAIRSLTDNIFTQPFAMETWIAISLTIILGSVAVKINFLAEEQIPQDDDYYHENYALSTMLTDSLANFCQEGYDFINRSSAGRLSQMMLFICSIVVFNYYSSGFFSILMQGPQMSTIKTLKQLADSKMLLGIDGTVEAEEFFVGSKHSDVHYMMKKKDFGENLQVDPANGIKLVRDESYAYHCDRTIAYSMIRDSYDFSEMCDLNEVEVMPVQWVGLMIRKDSPFRELFTVRLARLREVGAFKRFTELWITKKPDCLVTSVISSISLDGALPLFLLLIAGTLAAFLAFALESGLFRAIGRRFGSSVSAAS